MLSNEVIILFLLSNAFNSNIYSYTNMIIFQFIVIEIRRLHVDKIYT